MVHIAHNGKTGDDIEARSLNFQNLKTFLKNPQTLLWSQKICDSAKHRARRHHSFKLSSKLKYLNSATPVIK